MVIFCMYEKSCCLPYVTYYNLAPLALPCLTLGPYLSLVVVTRHDTNPGLFNTKFRLNFGRMANSPPEDPADIASQPNALIIGR